MNLSSRRKFLTGLGGVSLALPWLEQFSSDALAQGPASLPKRVVVVAYEMGIPLGQWRPSQRGPTFDLPMVTAPLEAYKDRCLFVSAIDNRVLEAGGQGCVWGHPAKKEASLTGTLPTVAFPGTNSNSLSEASHPAELEGSPANGPSVEHLIGQQLHAGQARSSVDLAVTGNTFWGSPTGRRASNFFFESAGNPISSALNPSEALTSLFSSIGEPDAAAQAVERLRFRNKSVLDAVRDNFGHLRSGLGSADQQRLDEHAARLRDLENAMPPPAGCQRPLGIAANGDYRHATQEQLAQLQRRNLVQAMACDLAPVGRLEFVDQQNPRFGIQELDTLTTIDSDYGWHALVHGDPLPDSGQYARPGRSDAPAPYDARLLSGYRWFVQQFATLMSELDAIPEGPGTTMLDNTMLVLASDLGEGLGHGLMKMGYILAGNLGAGRTGYHFDATSAPFAQNNGYFYSESQSNVNQLLNSMLDMAGVPGSPIMGLQGFLESRGESRRIDELIA